MRHVKEDEVWHRSGAAGQLGCHRLQGARQYLGCKRTLVLKQRIGIFRDFAVDAFAVVRPRELKSTWATLHQELYGVEDPFAIALSARCAVLATPAAPLDPVGSDRQRNRADAEAYDRQR